MAPPTRTMSQQSMAPDHQSRAREAVRVDGVTWRPLAYSDGDRCADCDRCDAGAGSHEQHQCRLTRAWFAGELVVCVPCFRRRVAEDVLRPEVELRGRGGAGSVFDRTRSDRDQPPSAATD